MPNSSFQDHASAMDARIHKVENWGNMQRKGECSRSGDAETMEVNKDCVLGRLHTMHQYEQWN
jgi:hypothetical protein